QGHGGGPRRGRRRLRAHARPADPGRELTSMTKNDHEEGLPGEQAAAGGRMPVAFLPHGGGPWPFVDIGMDEAEVKDLAGYLRSVRALPAAPPRALLVVSA